MARPRKDPALALLEGDRSKASKKKAAPASTTPLIIPQTISPAALVYFKFYAANSPHLNAAHTPILASLCEALAMSDFCTHALQHEPPVVAGSMGQLVPSPYVKIRTEQSRLAVTLAQRLALDPISLRSVVDPDAEADENPFGIE